MSTRQKSGNSLTVIALSAPLLLTVGSGLLGILTWQATLKTSIATLAALLAGLISGITARRFLGSTDIGKQIYGFLVTTGIGVIALGYLYLFFMRYPVASIGRPTRTLSQVAIFGGFLLAEVVGATTAYMAVAIRLGWPPNHILSSRMDSYEK